MSDLSNKNTFKSFSIELLGTAEYRSEQGQLPSYLLNSSADYFSDDIYLVFEHLRCVL